MRVKGDTSERVRQACKPVDGYISVCNGNYGATLWNGRAEWTYKYKFGEEDHGGHLFNCVVFLNDFTSLYSDEKKLLCHEIGHCLVRVSNFPSLLSSMTSSLIAFFLRVLDTPVRMEVQMARVWITRLTWKRVVGRVRKISLSWRMSTSTQMIGIAMNLWIRLVSLVRPKLPFQSLLQHQLDSQPDVQLHDQHRGQQMLRRSG